MANIDEIIEKIKCIARKRERNDFPKGPNCDFGNSSEDNTPLLRGASELVKMSLTEDGLGTFKEFWKFFRSIKYEGDIESQYKLFGKEFIDRTVRRFVPQSVPLMGTLTPDDTQFRVWDGVPYMVHSDYVDSMGCNLVMGLYSRGTQYHKEVIHAARDIVFPEEESYSRIMLPNGVQLCMRVAKR